MSQVNKKWATKVVKLMQEAIHNNTSQILMIFKNIGIKSLKNGIQIRLKCNRGICLIQINKLRLIRRMMNKNLRC